MNQIVAIIQARMESTRLPGKVLMKIGEHPMLWHVIKRLQKSRIINSIALAVSRNPRDSVLRSIGRDSPVRTYVGNELDVLDRYYQCASALHAKTVVRITADCPLIDPAVLDQTLLFYLSNHYEYVCNSQFYPDGFDVEVFGIGALRAVWEEAKEPYEREHVTPYMLKHMSVGQLPSSVVYPKVHLSVDTQLDFDLICRIYKELGNDFGIGEVMELVKKWNLANQTST